MIRLYFLLFTLAVVTNSHAEIFIYGQKKKTIIQFNKTKSTKLKTTNYHPFMVESGPQEYKGVSTKDIGITPSSDNVLMIDKGGSYSTEISGKQFFENNILAHTKNNKTIPDSEYGTQIIYSEDTLKKYPKLKERNFWCWWIKAIVIGNYNDELEVNNLDLAKRKKYEAAIRFPIPHGNSTVEKDHIEKVKSLSELIFKKQTKSLKLVGMQGSEKEIKIKVNSRYFIGKNVHARNGLNTLYIVNESKGNKLINFRKSYFYLISISGKE